MRAGETTERCDRPATQKLLLGLVVGELLLQDCDLGGQYLHGAVALLL